jgi:hypothetical protein
MGYDASGSRQFLDTLLTTQALHEEHRDQLRGQVASAGPVTARSTPVSSSYTLPDSTSTSKMITTRPSPPDG